MIEYKQNPAGVDFFDENRMGKLMLNDGKLSLTKLWEVIVRTKRLPDGFDEQLLFTGVRERLRDPEREVRQNALRVLSDLIPVTQSIKLDDHMNSLVPELITNLGHPAPALRKGALDTLRIYLKHSNNYEKLLKDIIAAIPEDQTILAATPYLITATTSPQTIKQIIGELWKGVKNQGPAQEVAVKSLARIRRTLGAEKFRNFMDPAQFEELIKLYDTYGLPIDQTDSNSDSERKLWSSDEFDDKVILETEITLKAGPAITMKIHEQSRPNSVAGKSDSEDDRRKSMGFVRIVSDNSGSDSYENARRTPKKVHFGGEIIKMRTPESDSNNEADESIHITVTDAISIKTNRSLIPIRITSLPPTPKKKKLNSNTKRLSKSESSLSDSGSKSKIPLPKRNSKPGKQPKNTKRKETPQKDQEIQKSSKNTLNLPAGQSKRRNSRGDDVYSPIPIHNEIELFHNLTRSPERPKSAEKPAKTEDTKEVVVYNSFQVCEEATKPSEEEQESKTTEKVEMATTATNTSPPVSSFKFCDKKNGKPADKNETVVLPPLEKSNDSFVICEKNKKTDDKLSSLVNSKGPLKENKEPNTQQQMEAAVHTIQGEYELWTKSDALNTFCQMLKEPNLCQNLEAGPATLFLETLFACHHRDRLQTQADDGLVFLLENLRPQVFEQCFRRLTLGLCRMGSPAGVKLALIVMKRTPPKKLQLEVIEEAFGHRTREGALQILMAAARLLPSNDVEVSKIAEFASNALRDRRRRIRQAGLELLASLVPLTSVPNILDIVANATGGSSESEELLQVVRARLSRRQLPSVELDGVIRYSSPREQAEIDWLSGATSSRYSASSSSSNSTNVTGVNYWKRNSRHEESQDCLQEENDESGRGNDQPTQIWAVDPSYFNKTSKNIKGANLRPVYILQPEGVSVASHEFRGHRRYDRGRSFSPPKQHRKSFSSASNDAGTLATPPFGERIPAKPFKYVESFRKSFSSEQLFQNNSDGGGKHQPYSFSSRSSTTSNSSSTRSGGVWQREFRSGIPIPISSDTKIRLRTNNHNNHNSINNNGPVIARSDKVADISSISQNSTPVVAITLPPELQEKTKIEETAICSELAENLAQDDGLPRSSGSESSGYFTPPPEEAQQAFVKLDTEEHSSDEIPRGDSIDSVSRKEFLVASDDIQNNYSGSSVEMSDATENEEKLNDSDEENRNQISNAALDDLDFIENIPPRMENMVKSKSVVDFHSFLPEIGTPPRKSVNSAPPLNDDFIVSDNNNYSNTIEVHSMTPKAKIILPGSAEYIETVQEPPPSASNKTAPGSSRLSRRFSRSLSKKSVKSVSRQNSDDSLRPFSKPKDALHQSLAQMDSNEWETTVQGLQMLSRVIRYHPDMVEANMHAVCVALAKHIRNLRSQVSRAACLTVNELFSTCKRNIDMEVEEVAAPLLQRTADTNRFLRADANTALDVMCDQLPVSRVVTVVTSRGSSHPNAIVRATSARLLNDLVSRFGPDRTFLLPKDIRDRILLAGANSLADGSLEARKQAKCMLSILVGHQHFQRALLEAVPPQVLRHISKTLNTLKSPSGT